MDKNTATISSVLRVITAARQWSPRVVLTHVFVWAADGASPYSKYSDCPFKMLIIVQWQDLYYDLYIN